jgi:hypothetical protein
MVSTCYIEKPIRSIILFNPKSAIGNAFQRKQVEKPFGLTCKEYGEE